MGNMAAAWEAAQLNRHYAWLDAMFAAEIAAENFVRQETDALADVFAEFVENLSGADKNSFCALLAEAHNGLHGPEFQKAVKDAVSEHLFACRDD